MGRDSLVNSRGQVSQIEVQTIAECRGFKWSANLSPDHATSLAHLQISFDYGLCKCHRDQACGGRLMGHQYLLLPIAQLQFLTGAPGINPLGIAQRRFTPRMSGDLLDGGRRCAGCQGFGDECPTGIMRAKLHPGGGLGCLHNPVHIRAG